MPQTRSLKEERVKIGQIIKSNPKQVKQGTVLRGPASLAVFSCGIRLTPLEAVIDGCSLSKTQRNQVLDLVVISGPISKGTSFSRMLLLGPFRTTHSYLDNSVSICPSSVSHYKWTLSKHPSVHAKRKVTIFNCFRAISHPVSFVVLKGPSNYSKHADGPKGEVSGDELESSRQGSRMEGLQAANGSDLRGGPGS